MNVCVHSIINLHVVLTCIFYLRFDETFWGEEEFVIYTDEKRGYYPVRQNMARTYSDNEYHVLATIMIGEQAHRMS